MSYNGLSDFYQSTDWVTFRQAYLAERLANDGELICDLCHKPIVKKFDAILHHVEELTEENVRDAMVALNPENIQLLHARCHNRIHERFQYASRAKYVKIVWGSPCAGKRAYVDEAAGPQDLIIDIDRLYEAMTTNEYRGSTKGNVLSIYRTLIDMVKTRNGRWRTAWIVRTLPLNIDRENILREVGGGELIYIDTPHDECLIEAQKRGGDWPEWVEQYWSRFQSPEVDD